MPVETRKLDELGLGRGIASFKYALRGGGRARDCSVNCCHFSMVHGLQAASIWFEGHSTGTRHSRFYHSPRSPHPVARSRDFTNSQSMRHIWGLNRIATILGVTQPDTSQGTCVHPVPQAM